ncbi:MAG TPA: hypothetical protein VFF79_12920 [Conexibacter sp.]|jgi:hypothetical protein|nr:hypothetical protein [Conexibacter sp.]
MNEDRSFFRASDFVADDGPVHHFVITQHGVKRERISAVVEAMNRSSVPLRPPSGTSPRIPS